MPRYSATAGGERFVFGSLARLLAAATPERSGDQLAGIAAESATERVAARRA
ncbi:ethanolamine ammonia-lyase subunit EutB, partial [Cereibacter sphaeroides]